MIRLLIAIVVASCWHPASALESPAASGNAVTATLITAEDGVSGPVLSAGLHLELEPGWKTYWRTPGEVGLPPELDWSASENVASVEMAYPAPTRFTTFDIENYGYDGEVLFPLAIRVQDDAAEARLRMEARLLVCAEICVPETVSLDLTLPAGDAGIDRSSADRLATWIARVPGDAGFRIEAVHLDETALTILGSSDTVTRDPQVFPEHGPHASFGAPDIEHDGRRIWARFPVVSDGEGPLDLTFVDGANAATLSVEAFAATAPPVTGSDRGLLPALLAALLGGLILNAMPCVLPVLSIKLASAMSVRDKPVRDVRLGFLASAGGIVGFFAVLAGAVIAFRSAGVAVGWGIQFQQPVFLSVVAMMMVLFAANLFGLFELSPGSRAQTAMGRAGGRSGLRGDVATGAFAALMATPCSAPFLGTAVAYALTRGSVETAIVFLTMGLGLSLPYLAVAARPQLIRHLPRPGRWMGHLKMALGGSMLLAAVWILFVLRSAGGTVTALAVSAVALAVLAVLAFRRAPWIAGSGGMVAAVAAALVLPGEDVHEPSVDPGWAAFTRERISESVALGEVVFVDVTADWCLTCKANKRLVLDRSEVSDALNGVVALRADWTRPECGDRGLSRN